MASIYLEFLLDKFVNDVEQVSSELPLLTEFMEIKKILLKEDFGPQMLIQIEVKLQEINNNLVEVEYRLRKRKFDPTRTGKDLWHLYKTGQRLSRIRDSLKSLSTDSVKETKTAQFFVIDKKYLPVIDLPRYVGLDDQMAEIETLLSKNKGNIAMKIVGFCGSGKTALAQKVIFSSTVKKLFKTVLWIDLSEANGSEKTYECITKLNADVELSSGNGSDLRALLFDLLLKYKRKKCLFVLDGVRIPIKVLEKFIGEVLDNDGSIIITSSVQFPGKRLLMKENLYLHRIRVFSRAQLEGKKDIWSFRRT